jgi:hypothetical protein
MTRLAIVSFVLASCIVALPTSEARAQSPNPSLLMPGHSLPMAPRSARPLGQPLQQPLSVLPSSGGPMVQIPAGTSFQTQQDRTTACIEAGAAGGVAAGSLGLFTAGCAN